MTARPRPVADLPEQEALALAAAYTLLDPMPAAVVEDCRSLGALLDAATAGSAAQSPAAVLAVAGGARPGSVAAPASPDRGLVIVVYGIPAPQGSKSPKGSYTGKDGKRHVRLVESSKKVKPWREAVAEAARIVCRGRQPLIGPLAASMVFTVPKPARPPAERFVDGVPYPMCYPDTSKLVRSTEDALTGIAWRDDAQVVDYGRTAKRYPGTPGALDRPGAVVRVWRIGGAQ